MTSFDNADEDAGAESRLNTQPLICTGLLFAAFRKSRQLGPSIFATTRFT